MEALTLPYSQRDKLASFNQTASVKPTLGRRFLEQVWTNQDLNSTQKLVAVALADHAKNETGECFPSLARLVERCALSRRGVQNALKQLQELGVIEIAQNAHHSGANIYRFLPPNPEAEPCEGGARGAPPSDLEGAHVVPKGVHVVPKGVHVVPKGVHVVPEGAHVVHPNYQELSVTPKEQARSATLDGFDEFWTVFPKPRNETKSRTLFLDAIIEGVSPNEIVEAAQAYAGENTETDPKYVAGSDSWLGRKRWKEHRRASKPPARQCEFATAAEFWATKVKSGKPISSGAIKANVAREMVGRGLVTEDELKRAGVMF